MPHRELTTQELGDLLSRYSDQLASADEVAWLDTAVQGTPRVRISYLEFMFLQASLTQHFGRNPRITSPIIDYAQVFDTAPHVRPLSGVAGNSVWQRLQGRFSQPAAVSLLAASLLMFALLLALAVITVPPLENVAHLPADDNTLVASVTKTHAAKWHRKSDATTSDAAVYAGDQLLLESGLAEIEFANGVTILLEGPARLIAASRMRTVLERGQLAAVVPPAGVGFTVETSTARVVDLGTEFGMSARGDGSGSVTVYSGAVELSLAGAASPASRPRKLTAGQTVNYSASGAETSGSGGAPRITRSLPDRGVTKVVQLSQALYDDAGQAIGIDMASGELRYEPAKMYRVNEFRYCPVPEVDWIDGVFIPRGKRGESVPISSTGVMSRDIPNASGMTFNHLWNNAHWPADKNRLAAIDLSRPDHARVYMHTNKGVTFDLDAIRRDNPGWTIESFQTTFSNNGGSVSYSVLIDGKAVREILDHIASEQGVEVAVDLPAGSRFLTLVTTESTNGYSEDWATMVQPRLVLRSP